jgi:DNA end-binding protein Ku
MARAIWTGTVSFGLVSIPVRLFNATAPKDVQFHQFDRDTGRRIRYRRVTEPGGEWGPPPPEAFAPAGHQGLEPDDTGPDSGPSAREDTGTTGQEGQRTSSSEEPFVAYEDVVKGYEVDRDRFVMVSPEELEALRPDQSRTIEIEHFVDLEAIDPVYFEKSYYLSPGRGTGAEKPYGLLLAAMEKAGKVGVARFVLRSKAYLAAIRPVRGMLGLETLFFDDEVRTAEEIDNVPVVVQPSPRELDVAVRLIELLGAEWDLGQYQDTYRKRVLELIEGQLEADEVHVPEQEPGPAPGIPDLMAALKASVEAAKKQAEPAASPKQSGERTKGRRRRTG